MLRILPEQLSEQLLTQSKATCQRPLHRCYLLCGPDPLLQQESQRAIRQAAVARGFSDYHHFLVDATTDWQSIDTKCSTLTLFGSQHLLQLTMYSLAPTPAQSQRLAALAACLDSTFLLILALPQLKKSQEQSVWFQAFAHQALYIACHPPKAHQLPGWIRRRAKFLGLHLDEAVVTQLCFHYEGNLLALVQLLERLATRYPDGQHLTVPRLKGSLHDVSCFTPAQWLQAVMLGQVQRAIRILQRLQAAATEPLLLLRTLQEDLLLLLNLKRQSVTIPLPTLFDRQAIWQHRRQALTQALQRLSYSQLQQAVYLLTQLECRLKRQSGSSWEDLTTLSLLLCNAPILEAPHHDCLPYD